MRKLIIAVTALAAAAPAFAQPRYDPPEYGARGDDIVRRLPPPQEIERIGDSLGAATDALMDVDVGPIADALDPYHRHYRRGPETLGDLAGRRDPYARERIRGEIGAVTVGLGAAMQQMAVMTPILRRSLEDSIRRIDDAIDQGRNSYQRGYGGRYENGRYENRRYDPRGDRAYDPRDDDDRYELEYAPR
jgi:hypothetical protein